MLPSQVARDAEEARLEEEALMKIKGSGDTIEAIQPEVSEAGKPAVSESNQQAVVVNKNEGSVESPEAATDVNQNIQPENTEETEARTRNDNKKEKSAEEEIEYYKHRLDTISGMLKKSEENAKILKDEIERLKLQSQPRPEKEDEKIEETFDKDFINEYGEELLKGISSGSRKIVQKYIGQLERKISKLESELGENMFWNNVDRLCPGASVLQNSPSGDFLKWLNEKPDGSRLTRKEMGEQAIADGDYKYVASLFNAYINRNPSGPRGGGATVKQLQNEVVPDVKGTTVVNPNNKPKPIYTESQIDKFYRDVEKGKYYGKEDEKAQIERQIELATVEGRIKWGV